MTQIDLSVKALIDLTARYVRDYQEQLRFVLADEIYQQSSFDPAGRQTGVRSLRGELFLAFVPGDGKWIAVHDVHEMDGTPIPNREDLRRLLAVGEVTSVARRVTEHNARFNLGSVRRNFNEPTLPLQLLAPDHRPRVDFSRGGVTRSAEATIATLTFRERERPTLIQAERRDGPGTTPVYARGEIVVDAATGTVRRTRLTLENGRVEVELITEYTLEPRLNLWVPAVFTERYDALRDRQRELIVCEAQYTNYRRFEVTGRIKI